MFRIVTLQRTFCSHFAILVVLESQLFLKNVFNSPALSEREAKLYLISAQVYVFNIHKPFIKVVTTFSSKTVSLPVHTQKSD